MRATKYENGVLFDFTFQNEARDAAEDLVMAARWFARKAETTDSPALAQHWAARSARLAELAKAFEKSETERNPS